MKQVNRLAEEVSGISVGTSIARDQVIHFWYDGRRYAGYRGDTLASALLANGVTTVGRSFKYHRPRGIFSAGSEEPNALVQLETGAHTEPNRRATEVELYKGLTARSQNCFPSVKWDFGALASAFARVLPAGFYYKTFMWPKSWWRTYEKYIRKAAGLGRAPHAPDPHGYDKTHAHCDVLVVGGGATGLQAACFAARSGARVILVDERNEFGGALLGEEVEIIGTDKKAMTSADWLAARITELRDHSEVTLLPRTTVTGCYDYNFAVANERVSEHLGALNIDNTPKERLWKIRAKRIVLACGSIERPLVFADNDRPGVMLAGAVRMYIRRFAVLPAQRVVVVTNNDNAYLTALAIKQVGGTVEVVDVRSDADLAHGELVAQARAAKIPIHANRTITAVRYLRGKIRAVQIRQLNAAGDAVLNSRNDRDLKDSERFENPRTLHCNLIAVSGGWVPSVHLFSQARGKLEFSETLHTFVPQDSATEGKQQDDASAYAEHVICAGACRGTMRWQDCLTEGARAGVEATEAAINAQAASTTKPANNATKTIKSMKASKASSELVVPEPPYAPMRALWILPGAHPKYASGRGGKKYFHELQNDSTIADLELAVREGFESVEHAKRYTTTGMATDQGKTSNLNALARLAQLQGVNQSTLGLTTYRPPYTPLTFGAIVGHERRELFAQKRTTPMHPWHEQHLAVFEDVGDWKRPHYFPGFIEGSAKDEEMHSAVHRECLAVRQKLGVLDASTLGKIDIRGRDAVKLLNMVYTNAWDKLAIGRCRYGVMLNEHGMVMDDGVTTRLGEHHYHMTTTTGGAARVLTWLEEWLQTEHPEWQVYCTSVTEQWAVASLNGAHSRTLMRELCDTPKALDADTLPFMSMLSCTLRGIPARIFRISFTGELAFEINVPARYGLALWEMLMHTGAKYGIHPYGTEAMHVLRAEKGFIIVGQDTDGTVTPLDLGLDWLVSKRKADFVGKRSLTRSDTTRTGRKQLVGLLPEQEDFVLPQGAHIVSELKEKPPMSMLGHVCSTYMSPTLGRSIALAMLVDGNKHKGKQVEVALADGNSHTARVTDSVFFDPQGERARA